MKFKILSEFILRLFRNDNDRLLTK